MLFGFLKRVRNQGCDSFKKEWDCGVPSGSCGRKRGERPLLAGCCPGVPAGSLPEPTAVSWAGLGVPWTGSSPRTLQLPTAGKAEESESHQVSPRVPVAVKVPSSSCEQGPPKRCHQE